jgi:hypothetical protein
VVKRVTQLKINDAFTCKVYQFKSAPAKITLLGDKTKRPEPAQHVIEFPGGAVEVSRTSDGNYWAHILVNRDWCNTDCEGYRRSLATVSDSRVGTTEGVFDLPVSDTICQIAALISPTEMTQ